MFLFSWAQTEGWIIGTSLIVSVHINATSMFIFSSSNSVFVMTQKCPRLLIKTSKISFYVFNWMCFSFNIIGWIYYECTIVLKKSWNVTLDWALNAIYGLNFFNNIFNVFHSAFLCSRSHCYCCWNPPSICISILKGFKANNIQYAYIQTSLSYYLINGSYDWF